MVIIFSHPKVREFLMKNGIVYSYRREHPKTPNGMRIQIGNDWATDMRGGKKIMDVFITPVMHIKKPVDLSILRKYVYESGFDTPMEWAGAIIDLNPGKPIMGWLYKVVKR